ncbi:ADP-ribosyltransferase domain-containing protein [Enterobacter bugandensis]|uniref:ADP-ribosyltransferase domain-containing protein n=1 Tax=Enterobacter bugandensis TaxID=881260 RepID=UPI002FD48E57
MQKYNESTRIKKAPAGKNSATDETEFEKDNGSYDVDNISLNENRVQRFISENYPEFSDKEVSDFYYSLGFTLSLDDSPEYKMHVLIENAKKEGITEEQIELRNKLLLQEQEARAKIERENGAPARLYIASSGFINNDVRMQLNPIYKAFNIKFYTPPLDEVVTTYQKMSEEASYARHGGGVLTKHYDAMYEVGNNKRDAIDKLTRLLEKNKGNYTSYRGVSASKKFLVQLNEFSKGNVIVKTDQFLSTSDSIRAANEFASGQYDNINTKNERDSKVIFIVEGNSGADISGFSYVDEKEILYPPLTYFKVSKPSVLERFSAMNVITPIFKLTEVPAPENEASVPFLTDIGKAERLFDTH